MQWTDIRITVPKAQADTAEAIATGISGGGIYIEDYSDLETQVEQIAHVDLIEQDLLDKDRTKVIVHLYLAPDENPAEVVELMRSRLAAAEVDYTLAAEGVEQDDWENGWKAYYHALTIGDRLAIVPSWEEFDTDRVVIKLDPGMAFGTGTHETTALCLEVLDGLVKGGERMLDIGTGSGILAIAALNGVDDKLKVLIGDLSDKATGTYNIITANIVANAILSLAPHVPALMAPGATFIASGVIDTRRDEVVEGLRAAGLNVVEVREQNGWVAILCKNGGEA